MSEMDVARLIATAVLCLLMFKCSRQFGRQQERDGRLDPGWYRAGRRVWYRSRHGDVRLGEIIGQAHMIDGWFYRGEDEIGVAHEFNLMPVED